mmetsp:Transcript_91942/g.259747  ORF Transcript_91942/g.259747 Transcript_91942/m.259747 type:complete len:504 (-) Transcript_91942:44-1555(-)
MDGGSVGGWAGVWSGGCGQKRKADALDYGPGVGTWIGGGISDGADSQQLEHMRQQMQATVDALGDKFLAVPGAGVDAATTPQTWGAASGSSALVAAPMAIATDAATTGNGWSAGFLGAGWSAGAVSNAAAAPHGPFAVAPTRTSQPIGVTSALGAPGGTVGVAAGSAGVPLGVRAILARKAGANALQQSGSTVPVATIVPVMSAQRVRLPEVTPVQERALVEVKASADRPPSTDEELRRAEEAAKARALATLAPQQPTQVAQQTEEAPVMAVAGTKEEARNRIQELNIALQAQLQQQAAFQSQLRQYESQRYAKDSHIQGEPTRFKNGYRPMRMCKFGASSQCVKGDACMFGHAYNELHPASPEFHQNTNSGPSISLAQQEVESYLNAEPNYQMKKKKEICHRMSKSGCLLGERCMFAHKESDIGTVALVIADERVKRVICRFWEAGKCSYGRYCVNAHGMDEIGKLKPPEELCPARPDTRTITIGGTSIETTRLNERERDRD